MFSNAEIDIIVYSKTKIVSAKMASSLILNLINKQSLNYRLLSNSILVGTNISKNKFWSQKTETSNSPAKAIHFRYCCFWKRRARRLFSESIRHSNIRIVVGVRFSECGPCGGGGCHSSGRRRSCSESELVSYFEKLVGNTIQFRVRIWKLKAAGERVPG